MTNISKHVTDRIISRIPHSAVDEGVGGPRPAVSKFVIKHIILRQHPTLHRTSIVRHAWCDTVILLALPFEKVRIVDDVIDNATGAPAEGCFALCAPHLVTAVDFVYGCCTFWTWFAMFFDMLDIGNFIRIAGMWNIFLCSF